MNAEKDMDLRVENDSREFIGANRHMIVTTNQQEQVQADKHLHVQGSHFEKIDTNLSLNVGGNQMESVTGNKSLSVTGNQSESVTGNVSLSVTGGKDDSITMGYAMTALSIRAWRRKTVTGCGMTSPFWGTDAGRGLNGTDAAGLTVQMQRGPGGRHYSIRKVVRNRRNEWVFSEMYAGGCYETHEH